MKTLLLQVGKTDNAHLIALLDDYRRRIGHYMPFDVVTIPDVRRARALSTDQQREREGEQLLRLVTPSDTLVLLDERGKHLRSLELAQWLSARQQTARRLIFAIGGPYGFADAVRKRADDSLALSRLTFSHQMVRLIFTEQLYRACTIIKGEPYHHE